KMIQELSAAEMEARAKVFISLKTKDVLKTVKTLSEQFSDIRVEEGYVNVYNESDVERIVEFLIKKGQIVSEIKKNKIGLEEYYIQLMSKKEI
ncbi:MAG: hypothetical protein ACI4QU_04580, partial [Christensenellales bacterium]